MRRSANLPEDQKELTAVAKRLRDAPPFERSASFKAAQARRLYNRLEEEEHGDRQPKTFGFRRWLAPAMAVLLLAPVITVVAAQRSLPGDTLYRVKRWSETAMVRIIPSLQDDIALRRSQEIKALAGHEPSSTELDETIKAYEQAVKKAQPEAESATPPAQAPTSPSSTRLQQSLQNLKDARSGSDTAVQTILDETIQSTEQQLQTLPLPTNLLP